MNWFRLWPAGLLMVVSCAEIPFFGKQPWPFVGAEATVSASDSIRVPPRTVMEVHDVHYDGLTLSLRALFSPMEGKLRVDRRLIPTVAIDFGPVSSCNPEQVVTFIRADALPPPALPEHLLLLEQGYWYGSTVRFGLFDEHLTGLGPECIETDITLWSFDGKPVAQQRIRAVRPLEPPARGGAPEELPAPQDAGSP